MGAIAIGGLAGLVLGLRGRTFKRVVYSSTGALTTAAICYPKKAEEGLDTAKHYINVGYNFVYGGNRNITIFLDYIYFWMNKKYIHYKSSAFKELKEEHIKYFAQNDQDIINYSDHRKKDDL